MLPLIISCPRGSNISPFRIQSYSRRKCCRFSLILAPSSTGPPPATSLTGFPQVCASIQKKVFFMLMDRHHGEMQTSGFNLRLGEFVIDHPPDPKRIAVL